MMLLLPIGSVLTFVIGLGCVLGAETVFIEMCGLIMWVISAQLFCATAIVDAISRAFPKPQAKVAKSVHSAPRTPTVSERVSKWCDTCQAPGIASVEMGRTVFTCESCGRTL